MEKQEFVIKRYRYRFSEEEREILGKAYSLVNELYFDYPFNASLHIQGTSGDEMVIKDEEMARIASALDFFANPDFTILAE
jgi:hypothetical protein